MLPLISRSSRKSTLFNLTRTLLDRNDRFSKLVQQGFRSFIGNDLNVEFWPDDWMGNGNLKDILPRVHALAKYKHRFVANFGHWGLEGWQWDISLRRLPLD